MRLELLHYWVHFLDYLELLHTWDRRQEYFENIFIILILIKKKLITLSTGHWGLIIIVGLLSLPPIYFAIPICEILGIDKKYAILISLLFLNNFFRITKYSRDTYFRINEYSKKSLFWNNCEHLLNLIISIFLVIFLKMGVFGIIYAQVASLFL